MQTGIIPFTDNEILGLKRQNSHSASHQKNWKSNQSYRKALTHRQAVLWAEWEEWGKRRAGRGVSPLPWAALLLMLMSLSAAFPLTTLAWQPPSAANTVITSRVLAKITKSTRSCDLVWDTQETELTKWYDTCFSKQSLKGNSQHSPSVLQNLVKPYRE